MTTRTPQEVLAGAALALAQRPELWSRLARLHVPGADGRCVACRSSRAAAPVWPCRLAHLARRARELGDEAGVAARAVPPGAARR